MIGRVDPLARRRTGSGRPGGAGLPSPAEEAVRVVPLLGPVEVEAVQPARRGRVRRGLAEPGQERRLRAGPQVGEQAGDEERRAAVSSLDVGLPAVFELPGHELAEDDAAGLRAGQDAIADDLGTADDKRQRPGIAVVDVRRAYA